MTGTPPTAGPRLFFYFFRHYQKIDGIMEAALRDENLTTGQYTVLSALKRFEPCTAADLARKQNMTAQSMSEYLLALEGKGLIERKHVNGNRRNMIVRRSEEGLKVQERCDQAILEAERAYLSRLDPQDRDRFMTQLMTLYQK